MFKLHRHQNQSQGKNPDLLRIKSSPDNTIHQIAFVLFYSKDDGKDVCCFRGIDHHPADIEHVTIEINNNYQLLRMYFGSHGKADGLWVDADNIVYENSSSRQNPCVYISLGKHGMYPEPKTYHRILFFGNDCCEEGIRWKPKQYTAVTDQQWAQYKGYMGDYNVTGMADKGWWNGEVEMSSNFWKRMFCFL